MTTDNTPSHGPGSYQVSHLVELYIAFTTRNENVDLNEKVAEKFATLDITDLTSRFDHLDYYINTLGKLVELDKIFTTEKAGKRIFGDQYARLGFIVACARQIFGRAGVTKDTGKVVDSFNRLIDNVEKFVEALNVKNDLEIKAFADVDTLQEIIKEKRKKS